MKTKKNWFVIVAAMIMSSVMIFASCSSDDDPMLPEVIESEVLDKGMDDTASSKPSINPNGVTTGTQFSYKSWIKVKGQTRAAFENKVEVTLNNVFANTDTVITVSNFDLGDYKTVVSKRKRSERQEGFVTVSDSVMVYSVQFAEFSFDYELDFEHAVYNDGVTKQNMPYHPIGTIKDKGYKLKQLDSAIDGEETYAHQQLVHSISVEFNGKYYDLSATVLLYRHLGLADEPYILRSELVSKNVNITGGNLITSNSRCSRQFRRNVICFQSQCSGYCLQMRYLLKNTFRFKRKVFFCACSSRVIFSIRQLRGVLCLPSIPEKHRRLLKYMKIYWQRPHFRERKQYRRRRQQTSIFRLVSILQRAEQLCWWHYRKVSFQKRREDHSKPKFCIRQVWH